MCAPRKGTFKDVVSIPWVKVSWKLKQVVYPLAHPVIDAKAREKGTDDTFHQ
jgi:hypothetical protein